jgi:glycosyltransferase involved in cell wall biosynthesis
MSDVTVSVIIPVFNAAEYLIDTLNSVCNQTYKNLEVIIVVHLMQFQ